MLLFADGFEHYGVTPNGGRTAMLAGMWANFGVSGTLECSTVQARTGTHSLLFAPGISGAPAEARFTLGGVKTTCGIGVGVYLANLPSTNALVGLQFRDNTNTPILTLCWQSDGSICARKGSESGTVIDISDSVLTAGTWNHVECKTTFHAVAGAVEVRVNGVTIMLIGGLNLGSVGCSQMTLNAFNQSSSPTMYWDDLFAWDNSGTYNNDFLGAQRILTMYPTGDTAQADWSLNGAGTGFGCINQTTPDADTTYLGSTLVNDKSDFSLPTLPPELVTIAGVLVPAMAKLDAAGIGNLKVSLVSAATPLAGPDNPLTTGYSYYRSFFEYDPNTSAPWTKAGLEAALLRLEKSL